MVQPALLLACAIAAVWRCCPLSQTDKDYHEYGGAAARLELVVRLAGGARVTVATVGDARGARSARAARCGGTVAGRCCSCGRSLALDHQVTNRGIIGGVTAAPRRR